MLLTHHRQGAIDNNDRKFNGAFSFRSFVSSSGSARGECGLGPFNTAQRRAAARQAPRCESPTEMMPVAFEQYAALPS
jgi:hypothetical protein